MSKFKSSWIVAVVVLFMFGWFLEIRAFNCSNLEVEGIRFDFTELNQTFNITNTEESPPTMKYTTYLINPCSPLTYNNSVEIPNENMCEDGTFICEIITHKSENVTL
ncbi:1840_t:CDS:2, partial [Acaulospora morrowiae]